MSNDPIEKIAQRAASEAYNSVYGYSNIANPPWESPIERVMIVGIISLGKLKSVMFKNVCFAHTDNAFLNLEHGLNAFWLRPQFHFLDYRIDIALRVGLSKRYLFVECDGHDFHERTKEQAKSDRARDRAIQRAGHTIFRFTGSEIWGDPVECVEQVMDWLETDFFKMQEEADGKDS